jgi:tetratricopeptide (TPR) repeat protein
VIDIGRAARSHAQWLCLLGYLLQAMGCAKSPGERIANDLSTIKAEEEPNQLMLQGDAFEARGDYLRAEQYFAAALERGAKPEPLIPRILRVCMLDGRYQLAAQYATEHIRTHPADSETRLVLGTLLAGLGEDQAAEKELLRVTRDKPSLVEARFALAKLVSAKNAADAKQHLLIYLQVAPNGPHAEEAKGLLERLGEAKAPEVQK